MKKSIRENLSITGHEKSMKKSSLRTSQNNTKPVNRNSKLVPVAIKTDAVYNSNQDANRNTEKPMIPGTDLRMPKESMSSDIKMTLFPISQKSSVESSYNSDLTDERGFSIKYYNRYQDNLVDKDTSKTSTKNEEITSFIEDKIIKFFSCANTKPNQESIKSLEIEQKIALIYETFIERRLMSNRMSLEQFKGIFSTKMFFIEELYQWWFVFWVPDVKRSRIHFLKSINFPMKLLGSEEEFINYCRSKDLQVTMLQYSQYAPVMNIKDDDLLIRIYITYSIHVRLTEIFWSKLLNFNIRAYLISDITKNNVKIVANLLRNIWKTELKTLDVKYDKVENWLCEN